MSTANPFNPSFGGMPEHFFGRSEHLARVRTALGDAYSPDRALFFTGNRGCGKTALLERLSLLAKGERWLAVDVHSARAVDELTARISGSVLSANLQASPKVSLPGGISVTLGAASAGVDKPNDLADALLARCNSLAGHRGVFLSIDEIQKIPAADMEEICAAVQMARRKGLPVALMMAGLPGSKEQVASYAGCTFMERVAEVRIGSLKISETYDAFGQLTSLVANMDTDRGAIDEMASFSQGYPYLMQLVGYHAVRLVRELYPVGVGVIRADNVLDAEQMAYEAYRHDVLLPSTSGLKTEMRGYLATVARLLGEDGTASTGEVARRMGKSLSKLSTCRDALIKRRLLTAPARGKVRFALPHLSRFFLEDDERSEAILDDEWAIR